MEKVCYKCEHSAADDIDPGSDGSVGNQDTCGCSGVANSNASSIMLWMNKFI